MSKKKSTPGDPKPSKIIVQSVRNRKKSIGIQWTQGDDEHDDNLTDAPLPSFYKALEACAPAVCSLCEFPAKDAEKIVVTGATFREHGDTILVLLVAKKRIKRGNKTLNVTTSILRMDPDPENATAGHMDEDEAKVVQKLYDEAVRYVKGDRSQGKIDFPEGEDEPEAGKKEGADQKAQLKLLEGTSGGEASPT